MQCAGGDVDGDLYFTCWDDTLLSQIGESEPDVPPPAAPAPETAAAAGGWLARAQEHMVSEETLREPVLVGRYYAAWQKEVRSAHVVAPYHGSFLMRQLPNAAAS